MKKYFSLSVLAIAACLSLSSCFVHAGVGTRHHRVGAGAGVGYHQPVQQNNTVTKG